MHLDNLLLLFEFTLHELISSLHSLDESMTLDVSYLRYGSKLFSLIHGFLSILLCNGLLFLKLQYLGVGHVFWARLGSLGLLKCLLVNTASSYSSTRLFSLLLCLLLLVVVVVTEIWLIRLVLQVGIHG